ncbi:DUF6701 domain-containing protein [Vibrio navarrensis]|uniref:MSHA biogenesis protein MshQ n=1 Tax=Vibrio navarrensis TaxID=29495 RepID=A0A099LMA2_9VIBR|nr:DUF6701 domain-containing protein [Vibrio navarrensis]KGK09303.1 MSHA biogenesis protein MshQ [Vibrio navarrensis]MBE4616180.1 MSHA biogenesis protein MshQ [Vibrio navarrensis]QOD71389.1 MSHA biogenesis protein MshQ [Vibrio navarrensis]
MGRIAFALLVLLASFPSVARDYQLSSSATNADLPTCSSNNWQQTVAGGIRTYHCANGSVSLSSGDNITATSQAILSADAGFSLAGSNTIGSATTVVDLVSSYGSTTWQGNGNRLFGNYQAANTPVTLNNVDIQGAVTTGGAIAIQGGSVSGDVRSNNHGIRLENTNVQGAVFAIGNILVDGSSVSGSIETPNNALTITDSTITGSLTANGDIIVTRSDVSGNITTPNNALTVTDSTITGSLTANGDIIVTRSDVSGNITTPNNSVTMNDANVVGSVSANGNVVIDNTSVTGNLTSTNNQVTLNNGSYVLGDVTAGQPNWGIVNINGGSVVEGNCLYNTVPANACGASVLPSAVALYHLEEQVWDGSASEVLDVSGNGLHGRTVNGAVTAIATPALPTLNNLGTCGYGVFNKSSNQYLEVPHSQLFNLEETLTVSAWIHPNDYPTGNDLMSIVSKDGNYEFHLDSSGRVFWYWEIQGAGYHVLTSTKPIPKDKWSHITIRYDLNRSIQQQAIFINGQLDSSDNISSRLRTNNRPLQIGQDQNFAGRAFDGFIDEVQIFSQALSNAQILQLYRQRHPCGSGPTLQCFNDDFQSQPLDQQWRVFSSSGSFTPSTVIVNGNNSRLRLTEAAQNQATASTFQRIFPAANNRVEVEFDYFAYGGNGADGVAIVFSDASVTPQVGAFGGPLGYGYKVNEQKPGFAGGWLGIGLDEYGNYSIEGGGNGPGRRKQSVALRGSGSGYSGYNYLAGTCNNGTINTNGDCLSPDIDDNDGNLLHRYRIVIDSTQAGTSFVTVSRRVGSGSWVDLIESINILNLSGQSAVPQELLLSITGSTGSSTNNHEIDNFEVCALNSRPVGEQINHFRISLPAQGLTCAASNVSVTACADENCNNLFTDPVIAYLTPNSLPSATGGWVNGSTISFSNGVGNTQLRRNSAGNITVDVSGSVPTSVSFNNTLCSLNGNAGPFLASNCTVNFVDSGFILDVPDAYANKPVPASLSAVRKDNVTEKCTPTFASVTKSVKFWSDYVSPSVGQINNAAQARINTTNIATSEESSKAIVLNFDAQGTANFTLNYPEAGQLELNAKLQATDDDQDLVMHGSAQFVRVPRALVVTAKNGANLGACTTQDINCDVFAKAGESFDLDIRGVAWQSDADSNFADNPVTQNYQHAAIVLDHSLIAPVSDSEGVLGRASHNHLSTNGGVSTAAQSISEVGVFSFSASAPKTYLGLNLTDSGLEIADGSTGSIGRFIPYYLHLEGNIPSFSQACSTFTYLGQAMKFDRLPEISVAGRFYDELGANGEGETENYKIGSWWRYSNPWLYRNFSAQSSGFNITDTETPGLLSPQEGFAWPGSVVIDASNFIARLENAQIRYDKPYAPVEPIAEGVILQLSIDDTKDLDGVCYQTSSESGCIGYDFPSSESQNQLWGRLLIHDTYGPETNPLSQTVEAQYFSGGIFRTNSDDSCSDLGSVNHFTFDSTDFTVLKSGTATPPEVKATLAPSLLSSGVANIDLSAPGAGNTGTIVSRYDLSTLLPWLRVDEDGNNSFEDSVSGRVQFGLYRGSDRVIWWRESN